MDARFRRKVLIGMPGDGILKGLTMEKRSSSPVWFVGVLAAVFLGSSLSVAQDVCDFLQRHGRESKASEVKILGAERKLGRICSPKYDQACLKDDIPVSKLYQAGIAKDDKVLKQLLGDTWTLWASMVDIDNDGVDEIRIFRTVGTAHCTQSYFFKRGASGAFHHLSEGYGVFVEEGRFCDGDLSFIRFQQQVFAIESYKTVDAVWHGSKTGVHQVCAFRQR
jgi:hypothetical protein